MDSILYFVLVIMKKEIIEVTEEGNVVSTKEVNGDKYFKEQERELDNIDRQIDRLKEKRLVVVARLSKKKDFDDVMKKKKRLEKERREEEELNESYKVEEEVVVDEVVNEDSEEVK